MTMLIKTTNKRCLFLENFSKICAIEHNANSKLFKTIKKVRVFYGGKSSPQLFAFSASIAKYLHKFPHINVEYINTDDIKVNHMTPYNLVCWLIDSDAHFIITHIHQGISY
jgi:hypothetical protein